MSQLLRRIYLEIRHNVIITFVLITLAAWLLEQLANAATGQVDMPWRADRHRDGSGTPDQQLTGQHPRCPSVGKA